ncbi:MAG: hypothetical protein AB1349_00630 [Elusimicrobiota bacterium]
MMTIKNYKLKIKNCGLFLTFIFHFSFFIFHCLYASFSDINITKNDGLAKSGVASISDISASVINPAGISLIKGTQVSVEYQKLFVGLKGPSYEVDGFNKLDISNSFLGLATSLPKNIGAVSFYWKSFTSYNQYLENVYALCYARNLEEIFLREKEEEFSVGVSLKYLTVGYTADEYTQDFFDKYGNTASGFSSDLGLKYSPVRGLDFGVAFLNIYSSDLGLVYENKPEKQTFLGASYKPINYLTATCAYSFKESYPSQNVHLGAEFELLRKLITLRSGINRDEITTGWTLKGGKWGNFNINYAFAYPFQLVSSYGSHILSVVFELPPTAAEEPETVTPAPPAPPVTEQPQPEPVPTEIEKPVEAVPPPPLPEPQVPKPVPKQKEFTEKQKKRIMERHYNKAIWHLQHGEDKQAIIEFEKILKLEPNHKPSLVRLEAAKKRTDKERIKEKIKQHWTQGVKLYQQKQFDNAKKEFEEILKINPAHEPSKKRLELIKKELKKR